MRESTLEKLFVTEIKKRNGMALKFTSPGVAGVPDRLILMKTGKAVFAEIKAPGEKLRPVQIKRKKQLESLGFKVYVIDNKEMIGGVIDEICST